MSLMRLDTIFRRLSRGENPFESQRTRVYAPLKVRRKRIRRPRREAHPKVATGPTR